MAAIDDDKISVKPARCNAPVPLVKIVSEVPDSRLIGISRYAAGALASVLSNVERVIDVLLEDGMFSAHRYGGEDDEAEALATILALLIRDEIREGQVSFAYRVTPAKNEVFAIFERLDLAVFAQADLNGGLVEDRALRKLAKAPMTARWYATTIVEHRLDRRPARRVAPSKYVALALACRPWSMYSGADGSVFDNGDLLVCSDPGWIESLEDNRLRGREDHAVLNAVRVLSATVDLWRNRCPEYEVEIKRIPVWILRPMRRYAELYGLKDDARRIYALISGIL